MPKSSARTSDIELSEHSGNESRQPLVTSDDHAAGKPDVAKRRRSLDKYAVFAPVLITAIPMILLLAYQKQLGHNLGSTGCMPNGRPAIPYTSSLWSPDNVFDITVGFTNLDDTDCLSGPQTGAFLGVRFDGNCGGYSFNTVRIIDLVFDVIIGRLGQTLLAYTAYQIFSRVLTALMYEGEIPYRIYTTVAFRPSSLLGVWDAIYCTFKSSRRARWIYACITLTIIYILFIPTLVSATTGYTRYTVPYVENSTDGVPGGFTNCKGGLSPAFGWLSLNSYAVEQNNQTVPRFIGNEIIPFGAHDLDWIDCTSRGRLRACPDFSQTIPAIRASTTLARLRS